MWLLTIMIWGYAQNSSADSVAAFTKELPTERICHSVGASYQTMATTQSRTKVQYQCIKIQ